MKRKRLLLYDIIFFITIALLVLASLFSYRHITSLNNSSDLVNHTNVVKLKLEETLSFVKEAESNQRGYLLTGDTSFYLPIKTAEAQANESINEIKKLTSDNGVQQVRIKEIESLVKKRFARLDSLVFILKPKVLITTPSLNEGKTIMNELRSAVNDMLDNEQALLRQREKVKDRFEILTPLYSLLFSVFAIILVAFVYSRLRKEIKLRSKAEIGEAVIHNFFQQVPAMLAILKGKDLHFEFANQPFKDWVDNREIIGKTIAETLPELKDQGFDEILRNVYETGRAYVGKETPARIVKNERNDDNYLNIVFQPYLDAAGKIEGIMVFSYDVTEMIINRRKIEELEQRSRLAIEASAIGIFDWDLQKQNFMSSPRLLEIFGFFNVDSVSQKELLGRMHPDDRPIRDKAVQDSLSTGSLIYEARVKWPEDDSTHWINVFGKIIYNGNKQALRMYGAVLDVTDVKEVLEEIKESESRFRLLSDSITQQVWTADESGHFTYFNKAVYDYSGNSSESNLNLGWINTIHPDEKADNLRKWQNAVVNGQEFISEHRLGNASGDYRWHISRAVPQYNKEGHLQMWVGTSTDVQEQKNFSKELEKKVKERTDRLFEKNSELRRSEDRYYSMVNELRDYAILLLDKDGKIQNWNKGAETIKGYTSAEVMGKTFDIFYIPEDLEKKLPQSMLKRAIEQGKSENEGWRKKKDGTKFWASVVITALHDESGNLIGFTKITRDLTDKKNAEDRQLEYLAKIEQKNQELEHNNAELESFNYIASHDLQEPLRKIQAFSQLIVEKEKDNLSSSASDYFNRITDAASRMQNLIEALINYSQTNNSSVKLEPIDLNRTIREVKSDLSNVIEEKKVEFEIPELPVINGDFVQLQQLFTNILSNAIKYNKPGENPKITIRVKSMPGSEIESPDINPAKQYWNISVEDNGIGFEQKYEQKIFELFQRLHGRTRYKGTGIGLAICKKIMRNHEGAISAIGKPDVGSTFNLFFPKN